MYICIYIYICVYTHGCEKLRAPLCEGSCAAQTVPLRTRCSSFWEGGGVLQLEILPLMGLVWAPSIIETLIYWSLQLRLWGA